MLEIKKIKVKENNNIIVDNLSLRIKNGKIELIKEDIHIDNNKLLEKVKNGYNYQVTVDDVLFNDKSLKKIINSDSELLDKIYQEINSLYNNRFSLKNFDENRTDIFSYVSEQVDINNIPFSKILEIPEFNINEEQSNFNSDHFVISSKVLNSNGYSLIQFIGAILGIGIIALTAAKVYGATVSASNVGYSGGSSGISSTNVQGAIDQTYSKTNSMCSTKYYCLKRSGYMPHLFAMSQDNKSIILAGTVNADACLSESSSSATNCTWISLRGDKYAVGDKIVALHYPYQYLWLNNIKVGYCSTSGCYFV